MSISGIGGSQDWYYNQTASSTSSTQQKPQAPELTDTAKLLGISTDQLSSDLASGETLSSLASDSGVSSSDLLSAVEEDLSNDAPSTTSSSSTSATNSSSDSSSSQLEQFAEGLINGTPPSGGPGGPGGPGGTGGGSGAPELTNTAKLLGISSDQLSSDLSSGDTLSSLASSAGVSSSDLLSAVESDLEANAPQGVSGSSSITGSSSTDSLSGLSSLAGVDSTSGIDGTDSTDGTSSTSNWLQQMAENLINGTFSQSGDQSSSASATYTANGTTLSNGGVSGSLYDSYS